ncbi:MAG: type II toxin-antitoxin system RelE/ParE family toxin [Ignavibacteria bacterium]|nr:type II toxin-antitoxin system RelE/ParE family toxin [Ignavibacteria bacterium]
MVKEVIWLKKAGKNFNDILEYLSLDWSNQAAEDFYIKTQTVIENIKEFPDIGSTSNKRKDLRKFLITKHNYIIYRVLNNKLIISRIVDTRKRNY